MYISQYFIKICNFSLTFIFRSQYCNFHRFLQVIAAVFRVSAGRLRRSNCRFLLNSMKYKKLEEKPRPRGYNRIIKRKPNSNGERSVHYVIHYHFYCSHLRKWTSRRARCRVNRRLPQNTITARISNFTHISISPAQPPSLSGCAILLYAVAKLQFGRQEERTVGRSKVVRKFLSDGLETFSLQKSKRQAMHAPSFWHLQNKCY